MGAPTPSNRSTALVALIIGSIVSVVTLGFVVIWLLAIVASTAPVS